MICKKVNFWLFNQDSYNNKCQNQILWLKNSLDSKNHKDWITHYRGIWRSWKSLKKIDGTDPRFASSCVGFANSNFENLFSNWYVIEDKSQMKAKTR